MKTFQVAFAVAMLLCSRNIFAEKMTVAVLDLEAKGVTTIVSGAITEMIRSDIVDAGVFRVVERGQMNQILKEQGFQASGCTDQACAVQVGKLLSANKILVGEVTQVGKNILITVRIVDVEKGIAEYSAKEMAVSEELLEEASRKISTILAERISNDSSSNIDTYTKSGYYLRSIIPGWGQIYTGNTLRGYTFLGAFTVSTAFLVWAITDYSQKKKAYDDLEYGEPKVEFDSKWNSYRKASTLSLIAVGVWGAIYIASWIDVLFFIKPNFSHALNEDCSNGRVFVSLNPLYTQDRRQEQGLLAAIHLRF